MSWQSVVERTVAGLGFELVEVERGGGGLVRVTIDRVAGDPRGEFIVIEDCEQVTRQLQHVLEVEGLDYGRLEVSSPGLDRPLRKEADFRRHAGAAVALTLKMPLHGRKRFQGRLLAPEEEKTTAETAAAAGTVQDDHDQGEDGRDESARWRLVLAPDVPAAQPGKPAGRGRRGGKPAAAPQPATAVRQEEASVSQPVLEFRLDEVREARLVPEVDFKGRRFLPEPPPAGAGGTNEPPAGAGGAIPNDANDPNDDEAVR